MNYNKVDYVFNVKRRQTRKQSWNEFLKSKGIATWEESLAGIKK